MKTKFILAALISAGVFATQANAGFEDTDALFKSERPKTEPIFGQKYKTQVATVSPSKAATEAIFEETLREGPLVEHIAGSYDPHAVKEVVTDKDAGQTVESKTQTVTSNGKVYTETVVTVPKEVKAVQLQRVPKKKIIDRRTSAKIVEENEIVDLSDNARLEASQRWVQEGQADALVGTNGEVQYAYGQSRPTVTCAPLHLCTIQLMSGENVTSIALGDSVRWLVQQASAGDKPVVVVKPTQAGLSTNMTVMTDVGRIYYINLVSHQTKYVPLIGFYDPQGIMLDYTKQAEAKRNAKVQQLAQQTALENELKAKEARKVNVLDASDAKNIDFKWSCKADNSNSKNFVPKNVFSSNGHVYVNRTKGMKELDAPAAFNASDKDHIELINYRVSGDYYVIDGNPSAFQLMLTKNNKVQSTTCSYGKGGNSEESYGFNGLIGR